MCHEITISPATVGKNRLCLFSPYGITSAENFPNQAINNCRDLKPGRRRLIARQIHKSLLRNTGFLQIFLVKERVGPENRIGNNGATHGQGDSVVQPGKKHCPAGFIHSTATQRRHAFRGL